MQENVGKMQHFGPSGVTIYAGRLLFSAAMCCKTYEDMGADKSGETEQKMPEPMAADTRSSDHSLIEAARSGDEAAFAEIIARYKNPITNYLHRFLNDHEEAVDLAQETFIKVYYAMDRYHTGYAFSTYIYRIATNLAISELRRRKRRTLLSLTGLFQAEDNEAVEFQPPDARYVPDAEFERDEQTRIITSAIAALPTKYRAPIVLREIEGLSYEEIAGVLELGLGTTKSRISRARALLREKLQGHI